MRIRLVDMHRSEPLDRVHAWYLFILFVLFFLIIFFLLFVVLPISVILVEFRFGHRFFGSVCERLLSSGWMRMSERFAARPDDHAILV